MPLELSPEMKSQIGALVARYPLRQAALLPVLHLVQRELGHLSFETQAAVARELDVPPTLVREVTTFYEMYHEHPEGQFHLELCTNIACHLQGADQLMGHLKRVLGIEVGHLTEDGVFSLMEAECLASCGSGPTMKCGRDYYEYLTVPAIDALLARFRSEAPGLAGKHYEHGPGGPHVGPVVGFEPVAPTLIPAPAASEPPAPGGPVLATTLPPQPAVVEPPALPPSPAPAGVAPALPALAPDAALRLAADLRPAGAPAPLAARVDGAQVPEPTAAPPGGADGSRALPSFDPPPLKRRSSGSEPAAADDKQKKS